MKFQHMLGFAVFFLIFFSSLIFAFNASSSDYSVDSYNTGLSGGNISSTDYEARFSTQYQQAVGNTSGGDYEATVGFLGASNVTTESATSTGTGTTGTGTASSSGGGGGSVSCNYDWFCSEWYPSPCPENGIQKRICVNRGTCAGDTGIPVQNRTCEYIPTKPSEPLFDITAIIPLLGKWVSPGDNVSINVNLVNVGNNETLDVTFTYWVVDRNNKLILEKKDTKAIAKTDKFTVQIPLPETIEPGLYKAHVQIEYDSGKTASAEDSFNIVSRSIYSLIKKILLIIAVLAVLGLAAFLIYRFIKKRREGIFASLAERPDKPMKENSGFVKTDTED